MLRKKRSDREHQDTFGCVRIEPVAASAGTVSSPYVIPTAFALVSDLLRLFALTLRSRTRLAAENLFLRKQLACYLERNVDHVARTALPG